MREIQLESGPSSASTHRLTQPSATLNRRYVGRPTNLAIEEVAHTATRSNTEPAAPSRLVNLRVHAADLAAAEAAQAAALNNPIPAREPIIPRVVEFGQTAEPMSYSPNGAVDMSQFVPADAEESAPIAPAAYDAPTYTAPAPEPASYQPQSQDLDPQALAMNIAADYAAASFGAALQSDPARTGIYSDNAGVMASGPTSMMTANDPDSIDAIARAASEAIAAIRVATEPAEIAEQIASLKAFAANVKSDNSMPEMVELGDTIEKFVEIAMKSTKVQEDTPKKATKKPALSSKADRAAAKVAKSSAKVIAKNQPARRAAKPVAPKATTRRAATPKMAAPKTTTRRPARVSTTEDQALRHALRSVSSLEDETKAQAKPRPVIRPKGNAKRLAFAFICATACVAAVIYFVSSNIPDVSMRVAAMQAGIEAKYPSYVPRDFSPSDISSENGKITINFTGPDNAAFTLVEEKSSWDSSALLRNYVEPTWGEDYTTTHEQGITVYVSGANAAWVNGGVLYKINANAGSLTTKQLRNIVTSL